MEQKAITAEQKKGVSSINSNKPNGAMEQEIDLLELFYVMVHHWKSLLLSFLIGATVFGAYHTLMVKPVYTASTELYITSTDSVISLQDLQVGSALTADYQSIITSRAVLNKVIDDLKLNTDYKGLKKLVSVSNPAGTHIIRTNVSTNNLALSRDIANDLLVVSIDRIYQIVGTSEPTIIDYSEAQAVEDATPGLLRYLAMGGMIGFVLVAAILSLVTITNSTLKTEDDIEKYLQLPVLSAVPFFNE